jgi:hypothetical protein
MFLALNRVNAHVSINAIDRECHAPIAEPGGQHRARLVSALTQHAYVTVAEGTAG